MPIITMWAIKLTNQPSATNHLTTHYINRETAVIFVTRNSERGYNTANKLSCNNKQTAHIAYMRLVQ